MRIGFSPGGFEPAIALRAASASGVTFGAAESAHVVLAKRAIHDPVVLYTFAAQLAVLPEALKPKCGPLLVVVEVWSDGVIAARWPEGRMHGEGSTDADALRDLAENIGELAQHLRQIVKSHKLAGASLEQWQAITAMFDFAAPDVDAT